jgi:hypothetical protein
MNRYKALKISLSKTGTRNIKEGKTGPHNQRRTKQMQRIILLTERNGLNENMTAFQEWMLIYTETHISTDNGKEFISANNNYNGMFFYRI